jgi:hypothetical protein
MMLVVTTVSWQSQPALVRNREHHNWYGSKKHHQLLSTGMLPVLLVLLWLQCNVISLTWQPGQQWRAALHAEQRLLASCTSDSLAMLLQKK